jgi:hypothetical protein
VRDSRDTLAVFDFSTRSGSDRFAFIIQPSYQVLHMVDEIAYAATHVPNGWSGSSVEGSANMLYSGTSPTREN